MRSEQIKLPVLPFSKTTSLFETPKKTVSFEPEKRDEDIGASETFGSNPRDTSDRYGEDLFGTGAFADATPIPVPIKKRRGKAEVNVEKELVIAEIRRMGGDEIEIERIRNNLQKLQAYEKKLGRSKYK